MCGTATAPWSLSNAEARTIHCSLSVVLTVRYRCVSARCFPTPNDSDS